MTLNIMDMLSDHFEFFCLIPNEGRLSEELKNRGIKYTLMGNQSLPAGVKGKSVILQYGIMSLKNICKSINEIRKFKPDVLYAPGPAALPWSAVCGFLFHKPVIWHLHHIFLDGPTKKLLNICGSWKSIKKIIAVSNCVGNQIENARAHEKVEVLYNPVDVQKYANGNPKYIRREIETTLNRKINWGGKIVVAQIGAITKNKCQDFFVHVISEIRKKERNVIGLIIGEAITDVDKRYKEKIIEYIKENNLSDNICMLGMRKDIPDFLAVLDCVLIPSQEGLSLVALEAMAAGCRVVASKQYGAFELLQRAGCGTFYDADGTANDAAEAIVKAINEQDESILFKGKEYCEELTIPRYKGRLFEISS